MNSSFDFDAELRFLAAEIPPEAAEYVSKLFSEIAVQLELKSRQFSARKSASVAAIQHNRHIDVLVAMEIDAGCSLNDAIKRLARYDVDANSVRYLWRRIKPRIDSAKRKQRRKTALRLKKRELSNVQIAKAMGCSTRTVQRLLSA